MNQGQELPENVAAEALTAKPDAAAPHLPSLVALLLKGSAIYALASFAIKGLNFLLLPLYTRYLTPADYGIVSLAEIVASALAALFGLGLEPAMFRLYFEHAHEPEAAQRYINSILRFSGALTACVVAISLLTGTQLLHLLDANFNVAFYPYIAIAILTAAVAQVVQYRLGIFQMQSQAMPYAALTFLFFLLTAGCVIWQVVNRLGGAKGMLMGKLLATVIAACVSFLLLQRWLHGPWQWTLVRETLPLALPLVPHQLMALGLVVADRFILEHYRSLAEVGIYSLAYTLGMAMFLITNSLLQAWSPLFYDVARRGETARAPLARLSSGLAILLVMAACSGSLLAPWFASLLDVRYAAVARLIPLVIAGYLLHGFFALFQIPVLQSKRTQFVLFASVLALLVNLGLNLLWIPRWGMYGAAYATVAGYGAEALLIYFAAQRSYPLAYSKPRIAGALMVMAATLALTQVPFNARGDGWVNLFVLLPVLLLWLLGGRDFRNSLRLIQGLGSKAASAGL